MEVIVTGDLGYYGSHIFELLQALNHEVTFQDDFSIGNKWAIEVCKIFELDILNRDNFYTKLSKSVSDWNSNYSYIHKITQISYFNKNPLPSN